ncbi:MAG: sulfatase [bacterium]
MHSMPNILLITDDQHRWDFYNSRTVPGLRVPTLDRLRAEGTTLEHAYANTPVCMPARMTWCHGRYASQLCDGVMHNWHSWPVRISSMPNALKTAGYRTALIGKLHAQGRHHNDLTDEVFIKETQGRGFDDVLEVSGKSFSYWTDCHWTHHLREKGLLEAYRRDLERRVEQLGGDEPSDASFLEPADSADGFIGGHARRWLQSYNEDSPFFLHASFCGPHFPIDPPAAYHRHRAEDMPDPPGVDDLARITYWKQRTAAYCGMIEQIDDEVGKLLDVLDQRGLRENTLVIFTTDHGDMMGHFDQALKGTPYDTSARTPIVARLPGVVPAGRTLDGMIEAVDLPVTLMDVAGLGDDPEPYLNASPGRSFWSYLRGEADAPRQWAYAEAGRRGGSGGRSICCHDPMLAERYRQVEANHVGWRMVCDQRWKYVYYPHTDDELFDLQSDPWEKRNRAADPACGERVTRMRGWLIESMRLSVAPSIFKIGEPTYVNERYQG